MWQVILLGVCGNKGVIDQLALKQTVKRSISKLNNKYTQIYKKGEKKGNMQELKAEMTEIQR